MDSILNGWFAEKSQMWPGQAQCLEIEQVLFSQRSEFQDVMILKSKTYGNILVLDGVIQLTERDEFAYQEMISHLPLFAHPNPQKVCVIGGGDGAVLTQIIKHKSVTDIHLCEIDNMVIEKSKEFFPQFREAWDDSRVKIIVADGVKYLEGLDQPAYDVIIVDSSDPIGPASVLFEESFYAVVKRVLRPDGIVCSQSECIWLHLDLIQNMVRFARQLYPSVEYAFTTIPTYPSGQIGFLLCSKSGSCKNATRTLAEAFQEKDVDSLRYYHPDLRPAAFILPKFAQRIYS